MSIYKCRNYLNKKPKNFIFKKQQEIVGLETYGIFETKKTKINQRSPARVSNNNIIVFVSYPK